MNIRRINLALQITAGLFVAGALVSLAVGLLMPIETHTSAAGQLVLMPVANQSAPLPAIESFEPLFARSLQAQSDLPMTAESTTPPESSAVQPAAVVSQLQLVGTIGNSLALIKGPDGTIAMIETGDDINGDPVLAIRPSQVDLRMNGKVTTLRMATPPDDGVVIPVK